MEYNTTRNKLIIPEYGRNIQKMVEHAKTIEDREKRNRLAQEIISVMAQTAQHSKDSGDFKHKLWDHLYVISDFDLDIDYPYPPPKKQTFYSKPKKLELKNEKIIFRYYGKNVELILEKAVEYEEGPEKEALIKLLANHLKKSYINWNNETITDEVIAEHISTLSHGKIKLGSDVKLDNTYDILQRNKKRKKPPVRQNNGFTSNNQNRGKRKYK